MLWKPNVFRNYQRIANYSLSTRLYSGDHGPPVLKHSMNDLPVPEGSWQEDYSRRNAKSNTLLGIGALLFAGAAFMNAYMGHFKDVSKLPPTKNNEEGLAFLNYPPPWRQDE